MIPCYETPLSEKILQTNSAEYLTNILYSTLRGWNGRWKKTIDLKLKICGTAAAFELKFLNIPAEGTKRAISSYIFNEHLANHRKN